MSCFLPPLHVFLYYKLFRQLPTCSSAQKLISHPECNNATKTHTISESSLLPKPHKNHLQSREKI